MSHFKVHTLDVENEQQNYIWLLEHVPTKRTVVVDPTDGSLVQHYCQQNQLTLSQIWLTHWHKDHIGGVPTLIAEHNIPVYGPREELSKIPFISHALIHKDTFEFEGLNIQIMAVPGHTLGHIVYYAADIATLFCGDTLFAMGCGRIFEGTYEQMFSSLQSLAALPENTQIYCSHEYTLANAKFALHVAADNLDIQQRAVEVQTMREQGLCTLPTSLALELKTNPFLLARDVASFQQLRELKDHF